MKTADPELRGSAPPPAPQKGCNPFAPLVRLAGLLFLTVVILYGLALAISRSGGFRDLLAKRLGESVGGEVILTDTRLHGDLTFEMRGVEIPHSLPLAACRINRVRLRVDWPASLAAKALVYGRLEASGLSLGMVETESGDREPMALTRRVGLGTWKAERPSAIAAVPHAPLLEILPEKPLPLTLPPPKAWSLVINGNRMQMRLVGVNLKVYDAVGDLKAEFVDMEIGIDPGLESDPVLPPKARYRVVGESILPRNAGGLSKQPLRLDILQHNGEWVMLELRAESRLLFWLKRLLAGEAPGPLTGTL